MISFGQMLRQQAQGIAYVNASYSSQNQMVQQSNDLPIHSIVNEIAQKVLEVLNSSRQYSLAAFEEKCRQQDISLIPNHSTITEEEVTLFNKVAQQVQQLLQQQPLYKMSFVYLTGMKNSPEITSSLIRGMGFPLVKEFVNNRNQQNNNNEDLNQFVMV